MAVAVLWAASPLPAQEPGRLTLIPAPQMAALVTSQNRITVLVGQARAELAIAPRVGERSLGPLLTNIETASARSRSLSESFAAVAVADGLSLPMAALCAKVAGAPLSEEDRAAVALARHQVEALSQALAAFRLEPAHGTVEAMISDLNADSPGKGRGKGKDRDELRESLDLARQRLAEALDLYSRRVLLPFADAIVKARGSVTDPAEAERNCASSVPDSATATPVNAEEASPDEIEVRREAASAALRNALEVVQAVTVPPAELDGVPRFIDGDVIAPRKLKEVKPRYTRRAQKACIEGSTILQAVISKEGRVVDIAVLRPLPGLTDAAVDAVSRWRFEPATLRGRPVEVNYNLAVNFRLGSAECANRVRRPEDPWQ